MNFDVKKYVIDEGASIRSALLKVEENHYGMIFVQTDAGKIVGLATDGDIRRGLLRGVSLDDDISICANLEYVSRRRWFSISRAVSN